MQFGLEVFLLFMWTCKTSKKIKKKKKRCGCLLVSLVVNLWHTVATNGTAAEKIPCCQKGERKKPAQFEGQNDFFQCIHISSIYFLQIIQA